MQGFAIFIDYDNYTNWKSRLADTRRTQPITYIVNDGDILRIRTHWFGPGYDHLPTDVYTGYLNLLIFMYVKQYCTKSEINKNYFTKNNISANYYSQSYIITIFFYKQTTNKKRKRNE